MPTEMPASHDGQLLRLLALVLIASEKMYSNVRDARLADVIGSSGVQKLFDRATEPHQLPDGYNRRLALLECGKEWRLEDDKLNRRMAVKKFAQPSPAPGQDRRHRGALLGEAD